MSTSPSQYGALFRGAYAALHGGRPEEPAQPLHKRPGEPLEQYLAQRTEARVTHGICPECAAKVSNEITLRSER